jgi:hypothetical protein
MNSNSELYHVNRRRFILAIDVAYRGGGSAEDSAEDMEQFSPKSPLPQTISLDTTFGIVNRDLILAALLAG